MQPKDLIPFLDLTSLNEQDTTKDIATLCAQAVTPAGNVAAVCVYSQFVSLAKQALASTDILIATVANFPHGTQTIQQTLQEIEAELADGADEIDVVIDYQALLAGNKHSVTELVTACKTLCGTHTLKVILETGMLEQLALIDYASKAAIDAGADFLKTSTGKVAVNATLAAADIMLSAIAQYNPRVGFKAAGGIRTPEQAFAYVNLAIDKLGETWLTPEHFRLGASSLLNAIVALMSAE